MTRIDFYFNAPNKVDVARKLALKAFRSNSHVFLYTQDEGFARDLDAYLWSAVQLSYLPHVNCKHPLAAKTPVLIGSDATFVTQADVLINLDAEIPDWFSRFTRVLEIVSVDQQDREAARLRYRYFQERGYSLIKHDLSNAP